jgi:uroporphyrinogen III methyltransferase/synthase
MLTGRATAALAEAALVLVDPDVSVAVQDAVREAHPQTELTATADEPAEVAKAAVTAAKHGSVVVRLVAGDPYTFGAVIKEVPAVARTPVSAVMPAPVQRPAQAWGPRGSAWWPAR